MIDFSNTKDNPLVLKTPPLSSEYTMHTDIKDGRKILVCTVGKTVLHYDYKCLEDAYKMLKSRNDWMELGNKDEGKDTKPDTLEDWARSSSNPVGGYYGLKKGLRGRFANYVSPLLEHLDLVELTHEKRVNKLKAK